MAEILRSIQPAVPSPSLVRVRSEIARHAKRGVLSHKEAEQVSLIVIEQLTNETHRDTLKYVSRFITKDDYNDIVDERNILHLCGYPLCNRDPKGIKQPHQINYRRPSVVLPATYLSKYCTREHYQASLFYQAQLSDISVASRPDITLIPFGASNYELQIALIDEVQHIAATQNRAVSDVIGTFKSLSLAPSSVRDEFHDVQPARAPADPHLVGLSDMVKGVQLTERDPNNPKWDASHEPLELLEAKAGSIEGYNASQ